MLSQAFTPRVRQGLALLVLGAAVALAGCADLEDERPATWSYIHAAIIKPNCTTANCHSSMSERADLDLEDRERAYFALVGSSCDGPQPGDPPRDFVAPGQPESSKLMYLLRGQDVDRMPPDIPLPEAEIDFVEQWILEGASCE